jgi:WD40 repeat protein
VKIRKILGNWIRILSRGRNVIGGSFTIIKGLLPAARRWNLSSPPSLTGSADKTARLWDLSVKDPAANPVVLRGHEAEVSAVAISPDNRWLVTGSVDSTARLWGSSAKDPAANPVVLRGHEAEVSAVAISPDNRWLVTGCGNPFRLGSYDKTARLWDLSAKDPAANPVVLRGHEDLVHAVAISPDNRWLVTGSSDNTARLWLLQVNELVDLARTVVGRNFSSNEWQLYFPGEKYRKTFPDLPGPD